MISIIPHPKDACVTKQAAQPKAHAARGQKPICSFHHGRVIPYRNTASQQAIRTHARTRTQGLHSKQRARAPFCLLHSPPGQKQQRLTGGKEVNLPKSARTHGFGMGLAALWLARLRPDGWGSFFHAWLNRAFVPRARVRLDLASFRWVPLARLAMGTRDFFGWERGGEGENGGL